MPDPNKMAKAREINLRVVKCCANCAHRTRSWKDWDDCRKHEYHHQKHDDERRMPAFIFFVCDDHELDEQYMERRVGEYAHEPWRET